ncbi:MAG: prepilin-type N-terminal cleavage/methylation domain-containing protein [Polyangiaceae bacterium]|nr:prepilin-type N-terminal cleavage/methylation domain-containing protein [Polyangiaceae bacterium]
MKPRSRPLLRHAGYTVVELMMAISLFAIGVTAIIALQKVTVTANQHAKNLAIATRIAQSWQEMLAADAVQWNHPSAQISSSDIDDTAWLKNVSPTPAWFQPAWNDDLQFGPAFDALGNPVLLPTNAAQANFCTHIRLSNLYPSTEAEGNLGNGLIRTEVRVFWRRPGVDNNEAFCSNAILASAIGDKLQEYYFVYKASAVRQNLLQ